MSEPAPESPAPEGQHPEGPSQPFGAVLFIFFILIVVGYNGRDSWWGIIPHLLALGILGWGALETYSPKTLADILKNLQAADVRERLSALGEGRQRCTHSNRLNAIGRYEQAGAS